MPKKKGRPRSREEQERIFKETAKASGADTSGKTFEAALGAILKQQRSLKMSRTKKGKR